MSVLIKDRSLNMAEFYDWFNSREAAYPFSVKRIPFAEMKGWYFKEPSGDIVHRSGKFFRIEGIRVKTNFKGDRLWEQPVINQPEIGILGIITKKFGGVRYFLMQAKMEPGNVNINQLSPTVQATKSNYTQVHQGAQPLFLDYFLDRKKARVLVDQLQSEQGARFLRKRNRNMIVEVEEDIAIPEDFCWLTLDQIRQLYRIDNFVNMDARSVLSCARFVDGRPLNQAPALHRRAEIISWFTDLKTKYECLTESIPLKNVKDWQVRPDEIVHPSGRFFSVVAVSVEAGSREVKTWDQPLLKQSSIGVIGFLTKMVDGVLHILIQAKVEPGFIDTVEMLPTVCFSDIDHLKRQNALPPFARRFLDCPPHQLKYSAVLSEEGGRFYHSQNRYMIAQAAEDEAIDLPENYIWMSLDQLMEFAQYNNYLSIETRTLLSCLTFM